jgi:hypothetical protein
MSLTNDAARLHITVTIQPGSDHRGERLDDLFDAFIHGRQLCGASDRPLRDAALELLELGTPADSILTARHLTGRQQTMTSTLESAAEGFDLGFDTAGVVLPFRRPARPIIRPGGDAA